MTSLPYRAPAALAPLVAALALGFWAAGAPAQTPAQPPAPSALPKADCGAMPEYPGRLVTEKLVRWRKEAQVYAECYKKYAMDRRELVQQAIQQYQEAANAAIAEYNAVVKDIQAKLDEANKAD